MKVSIIVLSSIILMVVLNLIFGSGGSDEGPCAFSAAADKHTCLVNTGRLPLKEMTPEQRHAQTLKTCTELIEDMKFKLYSEMDLYERRMLYSCQVQLANPDSY